MFLYFISGLIIGFILICFIIFFKKINTSDFINILNSNNQKKINEAVNKIKNINEYAKLKNDKVTIEKATPLIAAIYSNCHINIIKKIIDAGADINLEDENKNTPLMYAALYYNNIEIFDLLIQNGAKLETKNIIGANALMISVYNDNIDILKKIISLKGNINCQNNGGWSALMSVSLDKRPIEIAKILIENGADINLKNKSDKTALDIAIEFNNNEMVNYLHSITNS